MSNIDCNNAQIAVIGADTSTIERLIAMDGRLSSGSFANDFGASHQRFEQCTGLLVADRIYDAESARIASDLTQRFLQLDRPVLAYGAGAYMLNDALGGQKFAPTDDAPALDCASDSPPVRTTIFLTVGSKTAMTIGGSGWLTIRNVALHPLPLAHLSDRAMPAALTETSDVIAFEEPGRKWTIGVTWDMTQVDYLPSGFGNIFEAFVDRTVG